MYQEQEHEDLPINVVIVLDGLPYQQVNPVFIKDGDLVIGKQRAFIGVCSMRVDDMIVVDLGYDQTLTINIEEVRRLRMLYTNMLN